MTVLYTLLPFRPPSTCRNNLATSAPKNIPDWFLLQTICFKESQRFAVLKTKWLCIFYVKLYWIHSSSHSNKINTLGMEAITQNGRFCFAAEDSCRRIRLVMNMIGLLVLDITFTINTVDMVTLSLDILRARKMLQNWCKILSALKDFTNFRAFCLRVYSKNENKP